VQKLAGEPAEQLRQRLAVEREGVELGRPWELEASRHRRHPDLPHRRIGRDDELGVGRLLEHQIEDAVLQLDFEALAVRQWQQRTPCGFQRGIAFHPEFLLADRGHGLIKPSTLPVRLTPQNRRQRLQCVNGVFQRLRNGWSAFFSSS